MSKGKKTSRRDGLMSNVAWKMALAIGLSNAGLATNAEAIVTPDTVTPADVVTVRRGSRLDYAGPRRELIRAASRAKQ